MCGLSTSSTNSFRFVWETAAGYHLLDAEMHDNVAKVGFHTSVNGVSRIVRR